MNDWFARAFSYNDSTELVDAMMITIRHMIEGYFEANYSLQWFSVTFFFSIMQKKLSNATNIYNSRQESEFTSLYTVLIPLLLSSLEYNMDTIS